MNIEVKKKRKFIGNKQFYKMLAVIFLPIVLQQFITSFVGLLDNIMIGQVGNDEMVGVSLANQLIFVFNLAIFGSLSGASIFATQYYGAQDKKGYQEAFRFKLLIVSIICIIAILLFALLDDQLISAFINTSEGDYSDPVRVLDSAKEYLFVMLFGLIPFAAKEIYATTLREQKETVVPMISGVIAIVVNLLFNYLLIFGKLGFPKMGITGAAIATVLSRFCEFFVVFFYAHLKKAKFPFIVGAYKKLIVEFSYFKHFILKTLLLVTNETMWSLGLTLILKYYSYRGLDVVAAMNITNTVNNVFIVVGTSLGNATGIILGNLLGANEYDEAKDASYKILFASAAFTFIIAVIEFVCGLLIPNIYVTSDDIKVLSTQFTAIAALFLTFHSFNTCCYFTLRAGGKIVLTMLFDSVFIWAVRLPLALIIGKYTNLHVLWMFFIVDGVDALKAFVGYILVDRGIWLKQII